jgi:hypothetical protein
MEEQRDESDKLPEDAAPEQAHEDEAQVNSAREEAESNTGVPNESGQATGNPANAG